MLLFILKTLGICLSLLAWILLILVDLFLVWQYKENNKKNDLFLFFAASVLWVMITYNSLYGGLFLLQETAFLPSLNCWVLTLLFPLFFLYHKYQIVGGFPDKKERIVALLPSGVLLGVYLTISFTSSIPDKLVDGWQAFTGTLPLGWIWFRIVCCMWAAWQLHSYYSTLLKLMETPDKSIGLFFWLDKEKRIVVYLFFLLNVFIAMEVCFTLSSLLFALLGGYLFYKVFFYSELKFELALGTLADGETSSGEFNPDTVERVSICEPEPMFVVSEAKEELLKICSPEAMKRIHKLLESPEFLHDPNFCIKMLSREAAVNTTYVSRYFNQCLGCGFREYITSLRLRDAEIMLRDTEKRVADICEEVGFQSLATFYMAFNARYQMTPSQWRKNMNRGADETLLNQQKNS